MNPPPELAAVLRQILEIGLLRARAAGWGGDAAKAAVEADHLHNLPGLLVEHHPGALAYYWNVERPSFLKCSADGGVSFEEAWSKLARFISTAAPLGQVA